jgi:hypothetical protein
VVKQFSAVRTFGHVGFNGDPLGQADHSINDSGELRAGIETIHVLFASSPVIAALALCLPERWVTVLMGPSGIKQRSCRAFNGVPYDQLLFVSGAYDEEQDL